jgi:hypothetical protein
MALSVRWRGDTLAFQAVALDEGSERATPCAAFAKDGFQAPWKLIGREGPRRAQRPLEGSFR